MFTLPLSQGTLGGILNLSSFRQIVDTRRRYVRTNHGGRWNEEATSCMMDKVVTFTGGDFQLTRFKERFDE